MGRSGPDRSCASALAPENFLPKKKRANKVEIWAECPLPDISLRRLPSEFSWRHRPLVHAEHAWAFFVLFDQATDSMVDNHPLPMCQIYFFFCGIMYICNGQTSLSQAVVNFNQETFQVCPSRFISSLDLPKLANDTQSMWREYFVVTRNSNRKQQSMLQRKGHRSHDCPIASTCVCKGLWLRWAGRNWGLMAGRLASNPFRRSPWR